RSAKTGAKEASRATGGYVSSWLAEMVKLARAGVDDSVMLTFVDSAGTFNLGADQIIELRDLGVCTEVITAMIDHDYELLSGLRPMPASAVAASPPQITFAMRNEVPRPTEQAATSAPVKGSPPSLYSDDASVAEHDEPQLTGTGALEDAWQPV